MQEFGVLPFDVAEIPERLHQHGIIFALLVLASGMPEDADPGDAISAALFATCAASGQAAAAPSRWMNCRRLMDVLRGHGAF
jgi:hypothetical protein